MPTRMSRNRALAAATYDRRCVCCAKGPLNRRGMHVVEDARLGEGPLPVCLDCRNMLRQPDLEKHLYREMRASVRRYTMLHRLAFRIGVRTFPAPPDPTQQWDEPA